MACGIAGLSVAADSLSAIKYAKVKPVRDEDNIAVDFEIEGDYPKFGNNDPRVDDMACQLVENFMNKIRKLKLTVMLFRLNLFLRSHLTLFTVRKQGQHLVVVKQVHHLHRVQTQCTAVMRKAQWHH